MRMESIKKHLRATKVTNRSSTFSHALASALAPFDHYDRGKVEEALKILGQDPNSALICNYCGMPAATWDHIQNTTRNSEFSGYGHRLGNLLPCCRTCNERKGRLDWISFLRKLSLDEEIFEKRRETIATYVARYNVRDVLPDHSTAYQNYQALRLEIGRLLREADKLAAQIRAEMTPNGVAVQLSLIEEV